MKRIFLFLLIISSCIGLSAEGLRMPAFFSDGMVVQRDSKIPVWGWGEPGAAIKVTLNGKSAKTVVTSDGTWKVYLPKMKACAEAGTLEVSMKPSKAQGGPSLTASLTVSNVLVGDVFLCSGQSNMELPIRRCMDKVADLVKDYSNSNIRYLKFPHQFNYVKPNDNVRTLGWQDITPENCSEVSAICYFMAREIYEAHNIPVGLINSAVGGTKVESWMPKDVLQVFKEYETEFEKQKYNQQNWPDSVARMERNAIVAWNHEMLQGDTVVNRWRTPGYDFSSWKEENMFGGWWSGRNGSFWFRFTVDVDGEDSGKEAVLRMGAMKDADSIYVNGVFVGNTTYEYPPRIYKVPSGVLRKGQNEIMVHLISETGRANFTKGKLYQLEIGEKVVKVPETCQFCFGKSMSMRPRSTYFVDCPTGLYNAMIAPLRDFAFKGIIWYQGEANLGTANYADYLKAMVLSWREQFNKELPVVIMQLPGYMSRHKEPVKRSSWCDIREAQRQASLIIPKAGLGVTLDTGEWNDIHPQDKQVAGHRAALQMRKLAYGEKYLVADGPLPVSAKRQADGSIVVTFNDGQTKTVTESTVTWSVIDGKLRYCYDDYPEPEIFGSTGIPAPQFEITITE